MRFSLCSAAFGLQTLETSNPFQTLSTTNSHHAWHLSHKSLACDWICSKQDVAVKRKIGIVPLFLLEEKKAIRYDFIYGGSKRMPNLL
jgi:hypothetical protein